MKEIKCHGGTKKEELRQFVLRNKGKKFELHYENNLYPGWGDDDIYTYDTSKIKNFKELLSIINTHYIHNIKITI